MALILTDPNTAGPFTSFQIKDVELKVLKLPFSYFTTGNTDTYVTALPADVSIVRFETWVRTALSGNSVASPTVTLGTTSGGSDLAAAFTVTNTAGTQQLVTPAVGIMQLYNPPMTTDIKIYVRGGCSTGSPTAGEIDLLVYFVR